MKASSIKVSARIDAGAFRDFAVFDALRVKRRWRAPLLFALILSVCACVCFIMKERRAGASLLGWVLLCVGLGLPAAYYLSFFLSLKAQCKKMKLDKPRLAYSLTLDKSGLGVSNEKERASYAWDKVFAAHRVKNCVYIYITPQNAYLLPDGCADTDDDVLWALLCECMPAGRAFDHIK